MSTLIQRRRLLFNSGLALGLAPWALQMRPARACEFFAQNLRVFHPWTRASGPEARSAIVSLKIDEVTAADRLIGVESPVAARAVIGGAVSTAIDLPIAAGQELQLSEDGLHIELLELEHPLFIARSYPLRLVFERGGVVDTKLSVDTLPRSALG